jgi:hypothetical protein
MESPYYHAVGYVPAYGDFMGISFLVIQNYTLAMP